MGIRLTGFSTPFGGISWEYKNAKREKAKEALSHMLQPNMKLKVFISSICGTPKYDDIRKALKDKITQTQLADVYVFEQEEASTLPAEADYIYALQDSDVCIFLIDNKDGVTQGVQKEIDVARQNNIMSLYYFCDENSKEKTVVEQSIIGAQFAKSRTVHHFSDLAEHGAQALIDDIIKIYHDYCVGRIIPVVKEKEDVEKITVVGIENIQLPTIPKTVLKNADMCKGYILRFILNAPYPFLDGKTNEFDDFGCQFLPVLFEGRSIKQFNTAMFLQELRNHQSDEYYRVVETRWQAIQAYYAGSIDECGQKIKEALQLAKESKQPNWLIKDILIDLRNHETQQWHIKNRYEESDAQKELLESDEEIYYPVLDRINESLQDKYITDLYKKAIESPYSVTIGNDLSHYGDMLASSYLVSLYNGSLTQIRRIYSKLKNFSFFLCNKYDDWVFRRNLLMLEVYEGRKNDVTNLLNSYPEILNNMTSEDALQIIKFCDNHPLEYSKMISELIAFGVIGYYLDEDSFKYYSNHIINKVKKWLEDDGASVMIGNYVFANLEKVSYRMSQNELANICCLFIDRKYCRWYSEMFDFIARSIKLHRMDEPIKREFINHLILIFEQEKDRETIEHRPSFLHCLRKQDKDVTGELDCKIREYLPSYYEETYNLETTEDAQTDMPLFIRKYATQIKKTNETQGVNGYYFGYGSRDMATIRSILINYRYDYDTELMDAVIRVAADTLLYSKEGAVTKLDAVSLLSCIALGYSYDYKRNIDIYTELYNKRDTIKLEDISILSSNIDELALRIALNLLYSALGCDVSRELMEDMSYLQNDLATTISVTRTIVECLEASDTAVFPNSIQQIILQNALIWAHSKNVSVRWNTTKILLELLRTSENESIINRQLIHLIDTESLYVKNLIMRNVFKCENITDSTRQYILSKCETDPCFVVRMVCKNEKEQAAKLKGTIDE